MDQPSQQLRGEEVSHDGVWAVIRQSEKLSGSQKSQPLYETHQDENPSVEQPSQKKMRKNERVSCKTQKSVILSDKECMQCRKTSRRIRNLKWDNIVRGGGLSEKVDMLSLADENADKTFPENFQEIIMNKMFTSRKKEPA